MASYTTRLGDTPGKISLLMTGTPIHVADLVAANPQKPRRGGTFATLLPGEVLKLPDNWFKGRPGVSGFGHPEGQGTLGSPPPGYQYPGAFGPKYGGSGGQWMPEPRDQSLYPVTGGSSLYGQYYVTSQGQLTLGALIMAAHPDQAIPPGFQSAALKNANPLLAGVDPNVNLPAGTRVNIPSRWVDSLKKAGYNVGNNMGVGGCPKADAMLKQVDPFGIAMGVGYAPPGPVRGSPWKAALAIAAVAVAVGGVTAVATSGGWRTKTANKNPRGLYLAVTTTNYQAFGYKILAVADSRAEALKQGEEQIGAGTDIHSQTEHKNMTVYSESALRKRVGRATLERMWDEYLDTARG